LPSLPNIIECFDISNHGVEFAVGSMSSFVNGIPNKSGYRKFKIKTISGRDDFAMIGEIIKRRYYRLLEENSTLPDLILIDGGKGQLNAALKSLESLGLKLTLYIISKRK
jgi:Excinuclease ABC subunit C